MKAMHLCTARFAGVLLIVGAASADFVGVGAETYLVTTPEGTFQVIDLFAAFDEPQNEVMTVLDTNIQGVGFPKWYHNDLIGTNAGAAMGGTWQPQFPLMPADAADSFFTVGGTGPVFQAPGNTTTFDPLGVPDPNAAFILAGWFNSNPPNSQGVADDGPFHPGGSPWLYYTMLGRLTIEGQEDPASIFYSTVIQWRSAPGMPIEFASHAASVDYPCLEPEPGTRLMVLLDRTGSMNVVNPGTGDTICAETFGHALQEITVLGLTDPDGRVAVWTIHGSNVNEETTGFVTPLAASAVVAGLADCIGATPLADAICETTEELVEACADEGAALSMVIITDGMENISDGACSGPGSVLQPPPSGNYNVGSWHQRVYDTVIASGATVSTWYWEPEPFPFAPGEPTVSDEVFFDDLTSATGGYLVYIPFGSAPPPPLGGCCMPDGSCMEGVTVVACLDAGGVFQGLGSTCAQCKEDDPCSADLSGDDLVDGTDLGILLGAWGQNPAGDLTGDGVTDGADLGLMLSGWGPCSPTN